MVEIEDPRGITFKSWKNYARFLELEIKILQELCDPKIIPKALYGAKRDAHRNGWGKATKVMQDEQEYK